MPFPAVSLRDKEADLGETLPPARALTLWPNGSSQLERFALISLAGPVSTDRIFWLLLCGMVENITVYTLCRCYICIHINLYVNASFINEIVKYIVERGNCFYLKFLLESLFFRVWVEANIWDKFKFRVFGQLHFTFIHATSFSFLS